MFPINKYKFFTTENGKTVAVSTYAGKTVRGVAKCDTRDTFSQEKGRELAAARCAEKVAKKRFARAQKKYAEAVDQFDRADKYRQSMTEYLYSAEIEAEIAKINVQELLRTM